MQPKVGYVYSKDSCNGCNKSAVADTQPLVVMVFGKGTTLSIRLCLTCAYKLNINLKDTINKL